MPDGHRRVRVTPVLLSKKADDTRHDQSCQNAETETDPRVFQCGVAPVLDSVALIFFSGQIRRLFFRWEYRKMKELD